MYSSVHLTSPSETGHGAIQISPPPHTPQIINLLFIYPILSKHSRERKSWWIQKLPMTKLKPSDHPTNQITNSQDPTIFTASEASAQSFACFKCCCTATAWFLGVKLGAEISGVSAVLESGHYAWKAAQNYAWVGTGNGECMKVQCITVLSRWSFGTSMLEREGYETAS